MIATAEKPSEPLDVLVNNAGIQFVAPVEEFPVEKWNQIIRDQSLVCVPSRSHAAVPGMKKRKWGRIINTASAHSLVASPFKSTLCLGETRHCRPLETIALENRNLRHHGKLHLPGYVWTPLVEKQIPDTDEERVT